jgi:LacI family transcriptional regulator
MPTIKDVAKALNISITTVSRALDGYDDVAEETRKLVIKKAGEMGYTPNRAARQLRRQQTETIGFILPSEKPQLADAFYSEFIAGLGDYAFSGNFDLLVSTAMPNSVNEKRIYEKWVQGHKVDGIIVNRTRLDDWRVQYLTEQKMPFVSLERTLLPVEFFGVETDIRRPYQELFGHLSSQGHSRIAYIGGSTDLKIDYDRHLAYLAGLNEQSLTIDPMLVTRADLTPEGGYQAACRLLDLDNPPTAIVCINDLTGIGSIHAVHDRGLMVGRDIAIAGFDGISDSAHTQPPLTTLDQPVYDIARRLVIMLFSLIEGEPIQDHQIKIEPQLIIRESTGG